jgi:hypothetical protein
MDITDLIVALIGVLTTLLTYYAIPWLKAKAQEQNADAQLKRWEQLQEFAVGAVSMVKRAGIDEGLEQKYADATQHVKAVLDKHGLKYCDTSIMMAVENAVREIVGDVTAEMRASQRAKEDGDGH